MRLVLHCTAVRTMPCSYSLASTLSLSLTMSRLIVPGDQDDSERKALFSFLTQFSALLPFLYVLVDLLRVKTADMFVACDSV